MYRFLIIVAFTALILGSALVLADIPQAINYQGVLFDSEGDPAPGSHSITFSIYDAAVDGTLLYQETHSVTVASDGSFDAILGRTPLTGTLGAALNGESRFLGITVGVDTEISPRTEMVSSPYSFKVNTLDGAEGGRVKGGMIIEHNQARSTQGLMILSGSGTFDTIMICPLTCSTILRATNTVGDEVLDISVDPGDNSALMVIKGPGGDDMSTLSAAGMDFSSASLTRAFQKRVSLRAKEGLQVFADGNESEVVAQLTPTAEGSELSFSDAGRGVKAISISHKGLAVLGGSETDTAIFIDPINGTTTFKNSSGEAVHMPEGVDFYTNVDRYTAVKTVTIDAKGLTVLADDDSGDELVSIKSTATGPEILVSRGSGRASTGSVMINGAGLFVMNEDGTDTSMHVTNNGNILSTGQIAVGAGCSWGASRGDSAWSVVFGFNNTASGDTSTVSGGYLNTASGRLSTISGGANNNALSNTSTIGGGYQNTITTNGHASTIGGGLNNWVDSQYCVIAGGYQDSCGGMASTISGGLNNNCYGYGSAVGGGLDNSVEPNVTGGTIGGGNSNLVTDGYGTIAGGTGNEAYGGAAVGGGGSNKATGGYSAIPGGWYNVADGERSLAGGNTACALHNGAIVFSASMGASTDSLKSGAGGQFVARAASNFYLTNVGGVETAPYSGTRFINTSTGAYLTTGGVWTDNPGPTGDIRRFDGNDDILGQLENLPINKWSSKDNDKALHISPMAADFHAQFGLGEDDGSMASMDLAGVALVAVQELYQIVKKQQLLADELQQAKDELATKDQRIDALELRLTQMEAAVEMVLSQQNPTINGNDGLASTK